jgi:hypothetical protein
MTSMKIKNLLTDILEGTVQVPDHVWNFAWSRGNKQNVRFQKTSYEAIRVNDEFMLVRVPKQARPEAAADATTAAS